MLAESKLNKSVLRTEEIIERVETDRSTRYLTDIAKLVPLKKMKLDKVGVTQLTIPLAIKGYYPCTAMADLSISLDEFHRGTHMSRLVEFAYKFGRKATYRNLLDDMANFLMKDLHTALGFSFGFFSLSMTLLRDQSSPLSQKEGFTSMPCTATVTCNGNAISTELSIEIPIFNCCPCTLVTSEELFVNQFSHTQKGNVSIKFVNIDISFDIVNQIYDKYRKILDLLKREDEIYVVKSAFRTPLFCEDICREICAYLTGEFSGRCGEIKVIVTTEESIHPHSAYAEKIISL